MAKQKLAQRPNQQYFADRSFPERIRLHDLSHVKRQQPSRARKGTHRLGSAVSDPLQCSRIALLQREAKRRILVRVEVHLTRSQHDQASVGKLKHGCARGKWRGVSVNPSGMYRLAHRSQHLPYYRVDERRSVHKRLTPKLSRAAQWSRAHGKLSLPCGWRNEAASA